MSKIFNFYYKYINEKLSMVLYKIGSLRKDALYYKLKDTFSNLDSYVLSDSDLKENLIDITLFSFII